MLQSSLGKSMWSLDGIWFDRNRGILKILKASTYTNTHTHTMLTTCMPLIAVFCAGASGVLLCELPHLAIQSGLHIKPFASQTLFACFES